MEKAAPWRIRLLEVIANSGMTDRAIALKAGLDPSYIYQFKKNNTDMSIGKLLAVCGALDVSAVFILSGAAMTPQEEALLQEFSKLNEKQQAICVEFISSLV